MTSPATAVFTATTVSVIDDDPTIRKSLKMLIESVALSVSAFGSAQQFLDAFDPSAPGCVLTDLRLPGISGLQLVDRLQAMRAPIPVLMVTGHADVRTAVTALRAGVFDYLEKPFAASHLLERVQAAVELDRCRRLALQQRGQIAGRLEQLSRRERQVMDLLLVGKAVKQISAELEVSRKTVEAHRAAIFAKMQVENVVELIRGMVLLQDQECTPRSSLAVL